MFTRGRWPLASGFQTTRVWSLPGSPGKKTDQIDCERLAGLHQYALVRRSFIPLAPIRELRDLTRRRTHLQQRDQPHSPVAGDGQHRVGLGNEQCRRGHGPVHPGGFSNNQAEPTGDLRRFCERLPKQKKEEIRKRCGASRSRNTSNSCFPSYRMNWNGSTRKSMRWRSDPAEDDPLRRAHFALRTVPGIQRITGWTIITEIGVDMSKFPTPEQLASWAGLCPGNSESAAAQIGENSQGRRVSSTYADTNRMGHRAAQGWRISDHDVLPHRRHAAMKKAAVAGAHKVLVTIHRMFSRERRLRRSRSGLPGPTASRTHD